MSQKGFGQAQEATSPPAEKLILKFKAQFSGGASDLTKVERFFEKSEIEINEALLEALPKIFKKLTNHPSQKEQEKVAALFGMFGVALCKVPVGYRQLNLEIFWVCQQLALQVFTRRKSAQNWAATQNNLGEAYRQRIRGERADNLERAIAAYEQALEVYTREAFPEDWAMTQNNLGIAYSNRIRGERADNLERAIAAYEQALEVYTRDAFPEQWAMTQNNLGTAYDDRIRGERADNLERAIAAYEQALEVRTREAFPQDWAMTQNNLGNAYSDRIRGERAENLERAIAAYEQALEVRTREALLEDWAITQNNLGTAYSDRIRGERTENLERAIAACERALEVYTRDAFPERWAATQNNLAQALIKQSELTNAPEDLETAIQLLQAALTVATPQSPEFIATQYALGHALTQRHERSKDLDDLRAAERAYRAALEAISPEHYDIEQYRNALPAIQSVMGSRLVRDGQWQQGLQLLLDSNRQLSQSTDKLAHANALYQTAKAHEHLTDWDNARTYYRDALRLYKSLKNDPGMAKSHEGLGNVLATQGNLAKSLVELAQARELYAKLERSDKVSEIDKLYQSVECVLAKQPHPDSTYGQC
jgi:tetratricopeptide (TPR) repeat protein